MEIQKIIDKKIEEIISKENTLCILIIGAGAKIEKEKFHLLNDIDLFVIIKDSNNFEREVVSINGVKFDISYMSLDLFEKSVSEKWPLIAKMLSNYKKVYQSDNKISELLYTIHKIYWSGPKAIDINEIDYIRFKLYQDYEDILTRLDDKINSLFLMNNLFKNILVSHFKLNNLWVPKDKKILNILYEIDNDLFSLCNSFIMENNIEKKLDLLSEILRYVLIPFGGCLKHWEKGKFPVK